MLISTGDTFSAVEIRHLRALLAVGRTQSFSRAAAQLGYAQSAVSQQIAALERAVGMTLIDRPGGPRAVSLTEAGRVLSFHAERIVGRLSVARGDLAALSAGEAGTLRVGTFQSVGARLLPDALRRFRMAWPGVTIRLVEDQRERALLDLVLAGDLDIAFALTRGIDPRFEFVDLVEDPWVLLAPPDSPLEGQEPVPFSALAGLPLVEWVTGGHLADVHARFAALGVEPDVVFRTDDNQTLQHFVSAGLGHAIVGDLVVERGNVEWPTHILQLEPGLEPRRIGAAWARDRTRPRSAEAFIATAQAVAAG
jgi:DNA-binding transcriptional LysR family regulator